MIRHKLLTVSGVAAACCLLSSCNLDDPQNINTYSFEVLNHITFEDAEKEAVMSPSSYTFRLDGNKNLMRFESTNLLFDNANHVVSTEDFRYSAQGFATPYQSGSIVSFDCGTADVSKSGSEPITNLDGQLNSTAFPAGMLQSTPVMSYTLGQSVKVRTLRPDSYFVGESTISDKNGDVLKTKDGYYRLVLNPTTKKAKLAIGYLPISGLDENITLVLSDLPIELTDEGYSISKEETIAEVSNNPGDHSWVFKDLKISTADKTLTRVNLSFSLPESSDRNAIDISAYVCYTLF